MEEHIKDFDSIGPKIGEKWTIDLEGCKYTGLTFLGGGRDFVEEKFLIFRRSGRRPFPQWDRFFVITKDRFWAEDTFKEKENE